jgi:hypothetical protein
MNDYILSTWETAAEGSQVEVQNQPELVTLVSTNNNKNNQQNNFLQCYTAIIQEDLQGSTLAHSS